MPSTYSPLLRLELQATGENANTWGDKANVVFDLIEDAIAKRQALTVTSADVTLTALNGADDQSRSLCLACTGTLTGNRAVIVPTSSKMYIVTNGCTGAFTLTVKTVAGSGVVVPQGYVSIVYCDATNVVALTASNEFTTIELGGGGIVDTTLSRASAGVVAVEGTALAKQGGDFEVGHASDTTLTRVAAGRLAVEGVESGWRQVVRQTTGGTLTAAMSGTCQAVSASVTVNGSVFAAGDAVSIYNNSASSISITKGTITTLRLAGTTANGTRTLAPRGMATIWFNSATEGIVGGPGVT